MSSYRKDLLALAKRFGRKIEQTRGCHLRLVAEGRQPVIVSHSPKCAWRTLRNVRANLRRADKQEDVSCM